jgi:hypothetical protein
MRLNAYATWSIYIRTSNLRKLKTTHLPAIGAALEQVQFPWQILKEDAHPSLYRVINLQNLRASNPAGLITPVLRRAYRLVDGWTIYGLMDLDKPSLQHVIGGFAEKEITRNPIANAIFEIEPGTIGGMTDDGGWQVLGEPGSSLRFPKI